MQPITQPQMDIEVEFEARVYAVKVNDFPEPQVSVTNPELALRFAHGAAAADVRDSRGSSPTPGAAAATRLDSWHFSEQLASAFYDLSIGMRHVEPQRCRWPGRSGALAAE